MNNPLNRPGASSEGFTIMELTVVLVIIGLLLGGLLVPLSTQRDIDYSKATDKSLADIREALIGFAVINGRLPCPADPTLASGVANAGVEATLPVGSTTPVSCNCTSASSALVSGVAKYGATGTAACKATVAGTDSVGGVLPWATLGLLETDAWGNRYTYEIGSFFGRGLDSAQLFGCSGSLPTTPPASAAFALCTPGSINILAAAGGTALNTAGTVPAVVLSHGKTSAGAYTSLGTQVSVAGAGADETENANGDATFVSNTLIDDRVIWIPATQLMTRMIASGRLP